MRKILPLIFILVISILKVSGQKVITKGYFIKENDEKVNCWIINRDWNSNPDEFEYKLIENGNFQKGSINDIKEFGSPRVFRYIRADVDVDVSSNDIDKLTENRAPVFEKRKVFLKVLVEGKYHLYSYIDGPLKKFFYTEKENGIQPLIYKQYYLSSNNLVKTNAFFRQQLFLNVNSANKPIDKFAKIEYKLPDLIRYFEVENRLSDGTSQNYEPASKRDLFNLTLRPGINYNSLSLSGIYLFNDKLNLHAKPVFRIGAETEYIFPYFNGKGSVIFEPAFQRFHGKGNFKKGYPYAAGQIKYQSIESSLGLRYYYFLNNGPKLYANASIVYDMPIGVSKLYFSTINGSEVNNLDLEKSIHYSIGVGMKTKKRLVFELKYHTPRDEVKSYFYWKSGYSGISLVAGFNLI